MSRTLFKAGFLLILALIAKAVQLIFDRKSRKQKGYEKGGRVIMRMSGGTGYIILALGIMMFVFVSFVAYIFVSTAPEAWDEAGGMMLLCEGIATFMLLMGIWLCCYLRANMVVFDREKVVVCKLFKADDEVRWETLGRIEMKDAGCILYGRDGNVRFKVNAGMEHYARFCETAKDKLAV